MLINKLSGCLNIAETDKVIQDVNKGIKDLMKEKLKRMNSMDALNHQERVVSQVIQDNESVDISSIEQSYN